LSTNSKSSPTTNRISTYVFMVALVALALAVIAFAAAVVSYFANPPNYLYVALMFAVGVIAMGLSVYWLLQTRRKMVNTKTQQTKVMTTIECRKCGSKNVREFQRGDYVYKELETCQKCPDDKMIITAIYKEVKEKEKTYNF
jgi:hypothetical protein